MQARVLKLLNIRSGEPRILPNNNPGFLKPNELVDIVEVVIGAPHKGNNKWYRLREGGYVWSGGVDESFKKDALDWWHADYQIEEVWRSLETWGELSKITVIDSGIDLTHPFLDPRLMTGINAGAGDPNSFGDEGGHGTAVAGIIAGDKLHWMGIAPMCRVHSVKATKGASMTAAELQEGLNKIPADSGIVVISQTFETTPALEDTLAALFNARSNTVFVCAAGNSGLQEVREFLPARLSARCPNVISVAGLDKNKQASRFSSCKSTALSLACPSEEIKIINKFDRTRLSLLSGTSYAAPIVAGLLALAQSYLVRKNKSTSAVAICRSLSDTLMNTDSSHQPLDRMLYGKGIIDPLAFARHIQSLN